MHLSLKVISRKPCPPNKLSAVWEFLGKGLSVFLISDEIHMCKALKCCHNVTQRKGVSVQIPMIFLTGGYDHRGGF